MKTSGENIAAILIDLPPQPWTSAQVIEILARAEQAGHERALEEAREGIESLYTPVVENGESWNEGFRRGFNRGAEDARKVVRYLQGMEIVEGYPREFALRIPAVKAREELDRARIDFELECG
jgi:flagellar biosynthesis/type III secretory pathway protein FliH